MLSVAIRLAVGVTVLCMSPLLRCRTLPLVCAAQWLATVLLVGGLYTVVIAGGQSTGIEYDPIGCQIIGISLLGDAFIGFLQEYTMQTMKVRLSDMMAGVYTFCSVLVFAWIVARGAMREHFTLIQDDPDSLLKPLVYGWLSYIGNCFVQTMIGHFGVLLTVSCLNVRQVGAYPVFIVMPQATSNVPVFLPVSSVRQRSSTVADWCAACIVIARMW